MIDDSDQRIDLNPPARKPAADAPWRDDALQRQSIASELDALVSDLASGAEAATIALDGRYGTGKTFILERWVQEMHDRGQIAVYYNAWENDCDDDPLVSLIEALASNDKTNWYEKTLAVANEALTGILRKYTGIDAQKAWDAGKDETVGLLEAARGRRESRKRLKDVLAKLVEEAHADDKAGVIVVVDELDRCRPTFANELMERVKHVLNVPGLVFVFGVNIDALHATVKSMYGNIDAHQYLLRFFTVPPLAMPPGVTFPRFASDQAANMYLGGLADRHGLRSFCGRHAMLEDNLGAALNVMCLTTGAGRLTPREMERVVWLLSRFASSCLSADGTPSAMLSLVLVPLAIARIKDPDTYYETVSYPDHAPAVINCLFDLIPEANLYDYQIRELDRLEMTMYRVCHQHPPSNHASAPPAYMALSQFAGEDGATTLDSQHLSSRSTGITKERAKALLKVAPRENDIETARGTIAHVTWTFGTLRHVTSRFDVIWPKA